MTENPRLSPADLTDLVSQLKRQASTPHEIAGRNQAAVEMARSGWSIGREALLDAFLGRGPALQLDNDRGLIDSHRRRAEHLGQFFTPLPVARFMQQMLAIDKAPAPVVADLSGCGSGRLFWGLQATAHLIGVDLDADALDVARAVYPNADLVQDSLANRDDRAIADYVVGNPPFSDWITQRDLRFELARWGSLGPRSSVRSDIAAVELAIRAVKPGGFVAMIWPDEINDGWGDPLERSGDDHTAALSKWLKQQATPVFRIHLGSDIFKPSGTEWRTVILGWRATLINNYSRWNYPLFERTAQSVADLDNILQDWRSDPAYFEDGTWRDGLLKYAETCNSLPPARLTVKEAPVAALPVTELLTSNPPPDIVHVGYDRLADSLTLTHDSGLASAIRLQEWRDHWGSIDLSHREDTERLGWQYVLRGRGYYGAPLSHGKYQNNLGLPSSIDELCQNLAGFGLHAEVPVAVHETLLERCEWLALHQTPIEQLVPTRDWLSIYVSNHGKSHEYMSLDKDQHGYGRWVGVDSVDLDDWLSLSNEERADHPKHDLIDKLIVQACSDWGVPIERALDDSWVELHALDGIRTKYATQYAERVQLVKDVARVFGLPPEPFTLYPYQIDDVARFSMRDHNISYHEQATGKALMMTLLALVYHVLDPKVKTLIVTETRLIEEFRKASFGATQLTKMMRRLDDVSDLDTGCIWLTSYDQIWRKPKGSSRTWAQLVEQKGISFLACDEAHTLSAKNTQRTTALRDLAERVPKRMLASGTMIPSVPRNAVSTWTVSYGDNTPLNEWGYRWPILTGAHDYDNTGVMKLSGQSQTRAFGELFVTVQWLTPQFIQTLSQGAHGREMPALKAENLERWQKWMSTTIIRRRTLEPDVEPYARIIEPEIIEHTTEPTLHHAAIIDHYTKEAFNAFMAEKEEKQPCLLPILTNVLFAGTIPQSPKISNDRVVYREGLTSKQLRSVELTLKEIALGKKVMLSTERPELCVLLRNHFDEHGIKGLVFTGRQSIDERNRILTEMEADPDAKVMLATIGTGGTGLNLPFIGAIVNSDYGWKDSAVGQLSRRICRPAFRRYYPDFTPVVHLLALEGSLDPYQRQVCRTKFSAKAEAIDHLYQNEESTFTTWRDLIYRFFMEKGYDVGAEVLIKAA